MKPPVEARAVDDDIVEFVVLVGSTLTATTLHLRDHRLGWADPIMLPIDFPRR